MIRSGDVLLSTTIDSHKGRVTAMPGEVLVSVFLGAYEEGKEPPITPTLIALGWRRSDLWEVVVEYDTEAGVETRRTMFACDGQHQAGESAARFGRRMVMDARGSMRTLSLSVVRLGEIQADGAPNHVRGRVLFAWERGAVCSLDALIAGLAL